MPKTTKYLYALIACTLTSAVVAPAWAGEVKLVSDAWENVCRVEITWGANAPNGTPVEQFLDVRRSWTITKPDRLCYRRSSTPENCDSGMTQWNTQWKCAAASGAGMEEFSLQ